MYIHTSCIHYTYIHKTNVFHPFPCSLCGSYIYIYIYTYITYTLYIYKYIPYIYTHISHIYTYIYTHISHIHYIYINIYLPFPSSLCATLRLFCESVFRVVLCVSRVVLCVLCACEHFLTFYTAKDEESRKENIFSLHTHSFCAGLFVFCCVESEKVRSHVSSLIYLYSLSVAL